MVGLSGVVINSLARVHDKDLLGEAVLRTFSGSDSMLLLGLSSLHMWVDSVDFISPLTHVQHLSTELMDLCLIRGLLREVSSPLKFEKLQLFFCLFAKFLDSKFTFLG